MHAHVTPERYKKAIRERGEWHGLDAVAGELGLGGFDKMLDERLEEMDSIGVDMQLVTPTVGFYQYGNDLETTQRIARECNDEIAEMVGAHPTRFAGLATLPMQDPPSAIVEMERAMTDLGLEGVIVSDHVAAGPMTSRTSSLSSTQPRSSEQSCSSIRAGTRWSTSASGATSSAMPWAISPSGRWFRDTRIRRHSRPVPRPQAVPGPRRWLHLIRNRQDGQGGAARWSPIPVKDSSPPFGAGRRVRPGHAPERVSRSILL